MNRTWISRSLALLLALTVVAWLAPGTAARQATPAASSAAGPSVGDPVRLVAAFFEVGAVEIGTVSVTALEDPYLGPAHRPRDGFRLVLADLSTKNVPGKIASAALDRAHITLNANMVPGDKRTALDPSGVRMGSPAATTRGFKEAEMKQVANWVADVVEHIDDEAVIKRVAGEVKELCGKFPLWY